MILLIAEIVLITVFLYVGVIYTSTAWIMLCFCCAVFVAADYLYAAYMLFHVKCSIEIPIPMSEKNENTFVFAKTVDSSRFPVLKMKFYVRYTNALMHRKKKITLYASAQGRGFSQMGTELKASLCGAYHFRLYKVRLYGLLGFGYLTKYVKSEAELQIMPKTEPVMVSVCQNSRYFMGETEVFDDRAGGNDAAEIFQIRPFRSGDRVQSIHWKLSAKCEEWMVRENSRPLGCPVVILLDLYLGNRRRKLEQQADRFYQNALSLSFALIDAKCMHYITWYSEREKDIVRVRIDKEEKIYYFLLLLYMETKTTHKRDITLMYKEKYRAETYITMLLIDSSGQITAEGEKLGTDITKLEVSV